MVGAAAARVREAESNLEAARVAAGAAEKAAKLQARQAIDAARVAEAALREKEARAAWATEALRNAQAKAADQAASRAELNAVAIGEASARLELLYARYALEEAIADLEKLNERFLSMKFQLENLMKTKEELEVKAKEIVEQEGVSLGTVVIRQSRS